jgi:hypothetical protein
MFLRVTKEIKNKVFNGIVRFSAQFAPPNVVNKRRVARVLGRGFPLLLTGLMATQNIKGIVFDSVSTPAIDFMARFGFKTIDNDNHLLMLDPSSLK